MLQTSMLRPGRRCQVSVCQFGSCTISIGERQKLVGCRSMPAPQCTQRTTTGTCCGARHRVAAAAGGHAGDASCGGRRNTWSSARTPLPLRSSAVTRASSSTASAANNCARCKQGVGRRPHGQLSVEHRCTVLQQRTLRRVSVSVRPCDSDHRRTGLRGSTR